MNLFNYIRESRRGNARAATVILLALWAGASLALPDNPKDPPLPASGMESMYAVPTPPSNDASLGDLRLNLHAVHGGALVPVRPGNKTTTERGFKNGVYQYYMANPVPLSITSFTVDVTPSHPGATVEFISMFYTTISAGVQQTDFTTTIQNWSWIGARVTAEDGVTTQLYRVHINRQ